MKIAILIKLEFHRYYGETIQSTMADKINEVIKEFCNDNNNQR